ncbi:btk-binding protein-related [Anaeramoeba flamelloides]|uniref:Btk-binding protein-related n=1 Tax=Anaeramoeba flamelloides TaxID=1746091 RepID=A0AAV7Y8G1_9EUKA|nr:btk-binding protein-related [Anaeramoeba flamelloides]
MEQSSIFIGRNTKPVFDKSCSNYYQKLTPIPTTLIGNQNQVIKIVIGNIKSGVQSHLMLTKSGRVFSLSNKKSDSEKMKSIDFFNDQKIQAIEIIRWSNFFLCWDGSLYVNGKIATKKNKKSINRPVLFQRNISRVFGGIGSDHFFMTNTKNELYSFGKNNFGELSTGSHFKPKKPKRVQNWNSNEIFQVHCGSFHSVLVTKKGKTYSCGSGDCNGIGKTKYIFKEIPLLKNKKALRVTGGNQMTFLLTSENEIFFWRMKKLPEKLILPKMYHNSRTPIDFSCGTTSLFVYPNNQNSDLFHDQRNMFESKKYCDSELKIRSFWDVKNKKENHIETIPIHKLIVEFRTGLKIDFIQKMISQKDFCKKEINLFLEWIYYDKLENIPIIKKIFNYLTINFPPKNTLEDDFKKLYHDQSSKDFYILASNNDQENIIEMKDEKDQDDVEKNEIHFVKIPVHKYILLSRSQLFREMFSYLQNSTNEHNIDQIKDYTNKSKESLEILIKYFYTNTIEINEKLNTEKIIEELKDSVEYYRLNQTSNFTLKLNRFQKSRSLMN